MCLNTPWYEALFNRPIIYFWWWSHTRDEWVYIFIFIFVCTLPSRAETLSFLCLKNHARCDLPLPLFVCAVSSLFCRCAEPCDGKAYGRPSMIIVCTSLQRRPHSELRCMSAQDNLNYERMLCIWEFPFIKGQKWSYAQCVERIERNPTVQLWGL